MPDTTAGTYPEPKIHTLAQIVVQVGDRTKKFGWSDARTRKEQAAAWLRAQKPKGAMVKISWLLKQKAAEVPWRETGAWSWNGAAGPGLEYGAQALLGIGEWGRGR